MSEWQPIETAPKDGPWILLYDEEGPYWPAEMIAQWRDDCWRGEGKNGSATEYPTHWQFLPLPPKDES